MTVGDQVKYTKDDMEYLATIVAKKSDNSKYFVSVVSSGIVIESDGTDITKL